MLIIAITRGLACCISCSGRSIHHCQTPPPPVSSCTSEMSETGRGVVLVVGTADMSPERTVVTLVRLARGCPPKSICFLFFLLAATEVASCMQQRLHFW